MADDEQKLDVAYLRSLIPDLSEDDAREDVLKLSGNSLYSLSQLSNITDAQHKEIGIPLGVRSALPRQGRQLLHIRYPPALPLLLSTAHLCALCLCRRSSASAPWPRPRVLLCVLAAAGEGGSRQTHDMRMATVDCHGCHTQSLSLCPSVSVSVCLSLSLSLSLCLCLPTGGWLRELTRECVEANPGPVYCAEPEEKCQCKVSYDQLMKDQPPQHAKEKCPSCDHLIRNHNEEADVHVLTSSASRGAQRTAEFTAPSSQTHCHPLTPSLSLSLLLSLLLRLCLCRRSSASASLPRPRVLLCVLAAAGGGGRRQTAVIMRTPR